MDKKIFLAKGAHVTRSGFSWESGWHMVQCGSKR